MIPKRVNVLLFFLARTGSAERKMNTLKTIPFEQFLLLIQLMFIQALSNEFHCVVLNGFPAQGCKYFLLITTCKLFR